MAPRNIAIVGSGPVGISLAKQLTKANYSVSISNSRGPESLREQAQETGAKPLEVAEAVGAAGIIILAVPMLSIPALSHTISALLSPEAIILDTCNYYPSRDGRIEKIDQGLAETVWTATYFPVPVVKAMNNIVAGNMVTSGRPRGSEARVALPVSGNDEEAVNIILNLVEDMGFDAYKAGPLADSWRYQPGQPAYCTEPTLAQLPGLLAKADPIRGPIDRERVRAIYEKLPNGYSSQDLLRLSRLAAGLDRWNLRNWLAAIAVLFAAARGWLRG